MSEVGAPAFDLGGTRCILCTVGPGLCGGIAVVDRLCAGTFAQFGPRQVREISLYPARVVALHRISNAAHRAKFVYRLLIAMIRGADLAVVGHIGLLKALPRRLSRRADLAVWVYGIELDRHDAARLLARADHVLAISEFTADRVRPMLSDRQRLSIVTLAVEPGRWPQQRPVAASRRPAVLVVSRLDETERGKGHDQLIPAMAAVRDSQPDAELWVVGDGSDRERLQRLAEVAAPGAVRFFGHVTDNELDDLYRTASVFAMPSRQEGFGLVYAEAMLRSLPCIVSNADAGCEIVEHGLTGLAVPYGEVPALVNAILELLDDPVAAQAMGERGRQHAEATFNAEAFGQRLRAALFAEPRLVGG